MTDNTNRLRAALILLEQVDFTAFPGLYDAMPWKALEAATGAAPVERTNISGCEPGDKDYPLLLAYAEAFYRRNQREAHLIRKGGGGYIYVTGSPDGGENAYRRSQIERMTHNLHEWADDEGR